MLAQQLGSAAAVALLDRLQDFMVLAEFIANRADLVIGLVHVMLALGLYHHVKAPGKIAHGIGANIIQRRCQQLGVGMVVEHKRFGEGVITGMPKGKIRIAFEEGTKSFQARTLAESGMLKL